MKDYGVVYAHVEGKGSDPYLLGINFARLGISKQKMLNNYIKGLYDTDWFTQLEKGYDNVDSDTTPKINREQEDTIELFKELLSFPVFQTLNVGKIKYEESSGDSHSFPGQGAETSVELKWINFIRVVIKLCETQYTDGSYGKHYTVQVELSNINKEDIYGQDDVEFNIDYGGIKFKFVPCGYISRGFENNVYRIKYLGFENRSSHNVFPPVEVIATLIQEITNYFSPYLNFGPI